MGRSLLSNYDTPEQSFATTSNSLLTGPPTIMIVYLLQATQAQIQELEAELQQKEAEICRLMAETRNLQSRVPVSHLSSVYWY